MIRSKTFTLAILGALLLLPLAATPARADHDGWSFGAGFHIGDAYFTLAFGGHDRHRPGYYYRTDRHIDYRGHRCTDRCFRDGRFAYHDASCPLLGAHLSHHRVDVPVLFDRYAPPPVWRGDYYDVRFSWEDRYDRHDRYGRHDRYDRRHRHDRYDDWRDRRGRFERHERYDRRYDRSGRRHDRGHHRDRHRGHDRHHDHHPGCGHR